MDVIHVATTPQGCTPSVGNSVTSFDLGHGTFVATQLIVSPDGSTAYIITPNSSSVLVFNITAQTSSAIALTGNAVPLRVALTPDGGRLLVGASDGTLHVLQTATGGDIAQIPFPQGLCQDSAGQPFQGLTCNPDLVAVKP
jgi:DNA-binding beta-propeller fold protein YncE